MRTAVLLLALAGCAPAGQGGMGDLAAWREWILDPRKPATRYTRLDDGTVRAEAQSSVSGLLHEAPVVPHPGMRLRWRWKVERLPSGADERYAMSDDSAARIVVAFDGDRASLEPTERAKLALASALSGRETPYATLMYIWSAAHEPETMIINPRSSRVRMIVVEQGAARLGRWLDYERDLSADVRRAFGEVPRLITGLGVLTDADDTQSSAVAYYGSVVLAP